MTSIHSWFATVRRRLLPSHLDEQAPPFWSLFYLLFLFVNWAEQPLRVWLAPTLLSIAIFLPLYFRAFHHKGARRFAHVAAIAALGFAMAPINSCAHTYLIYAASSLPFCGLLLRQSIATIFGVLVLYSLELYYVGYPPKYALFVAIITGVIAVAVCAANHYHREKHLRQAELKLSHDEVRRLAALAERERIGRDLHDLLGHTLSLITLKSELAMKLFERDPQAARREIAEVERVARDALAQVRRAVSGIRAAGLAAELASARLLLESSDVRLDYRLGEAALPPEVETVFALTVREAVTNIQRHAQAMSVRVDLAVHGGEARLSIEDDGRGGAIEPGNGLTGMRERLHALGGRLEIQSRAGQGTRLVAALPLPEAWLPAVPIGAALR
ncbi:sensor histidine kinase [Dokdonella sp.]|uniref:sensor histidine kinase n=1 Tax=Dokdonella sp. TaxID=2291710 RepID=UPI001B2B3E75|nr:sensor histidine kinase [Dokdonella sp.]MBO9663666.1 sensor histidine kinase [Dokdonella sp.]